MPFWERSVMSLREEFAGLANAPGANRRELCRRFGISAPAGYRWLQRYLDVLPRNVVHRREAGTAPPTPPCGRR